MFSRFSRTCTLAFSAFSLSLPTLGWAQNTVPQSFIDKVSATYQLSPNWVAEQTAKATLQQTIIDRMEKPWEAKPWYLYQSIFLKQKRVDEGLAFWREHQTDLERAEREFGVPAQIMVAIIGVETHFGSFKGKDSVLDSLYTLAFHYPKRGAFFESELGHFLALSYEQGWQPETIKGSYAGAMGYPQFISSSYRAYAVDFDGNGKRDLIDSPKDALGSVANYFAEHGWQKDACVVAEATEIGNAESLSQTDTKLRYTWADLQQAGVKTSLPLKPKDNALLFPLEQSAQHNQYYVGCNNFYVITRYNHSRLYAMAVYQLSEWLKREWVATH